MENQIEDQVAKRIDMLEDQVAKRIETQPGNNLTNVVSQTKIADRVSTINSGLTKLNDQYGHMTDLIRPMLRSRMPQPDTAMEKVPSESQLLISNEFYC